MPTDFDLSHCKWLSPEASTMKTRKPYTSSYTGEVRMPSWVCWCENFARGLFYGMCVYNTLVSTMLGDDMDNGCLLFRLSDVEKQLLLRAYWLIFPPIIPWSEQFIVTLYLAMYMTRKRKMIIDTSVCRSYIMEMRERPGDDSICKQHIYTVPLSL